MTNLILCDDKGSKIRDIPSGQAVTVHRGKQIIRVVTDAGPVTFVVSDSDGHTWIRTEKVSPFFVSGDAGGLPQPWNVGAGQYTVTVVVGPSHENVWTSVSVILPPSPPPVVVPPPVVSPPPPVVVSKPPPVTVAARVGTPAKRDYGLWVTKAGTYSDMTLKGFSHCVSVKAPGQKVSFARMRLLLANRFHFTDQFGGQNMYIDESAGVTLEEMFMGWGGWSDGVHWKAKNQYRHDLYGNSDGGFVTGNLCAFIAGSSCGAQLRDGGHLTNSLFADNAYGCMAVGGTVTLEDCWFYGPVRTLNMQGEEPGSLEGNCGVSAYTDLILKRCHFIGRPGRTGPGIHLPGYNNTEILSRGLKNFNSGVVNVSNGHDKNPNGVGKITAVDCTYTDNWPVSSFPNQATGGDKGLHWSGDPGFDGKGFTKVTYKKDVSLAFDTLMMKLATDDSMWIGKTIKEAIELLKSSIA